MHAIARWGIVALGAATLGAYAAGLGPRIGAEIRPTAEAGRGPAERQGPPEVASRYGLGGAPTWRAELPDDLMEISGLAFTADGRLFAHGDEVATVWELDPRSGTVRK